MQKISSFAILLWMAATLPSFAQVHSAGDHCYADAVSAYQAMKNEQRTVKKLGERMNINTATASDFLTLQGIGVNTAERIIRHRTQIGRFRHVDELMQVKGIGQATLDKNRHRLSVSD